MVPSDMAEEIEKSAKSFPDAHFDFLETKVLDSKTLVLRVQYKGTHTGAPYGFGPYEAVPAKGVSVKNDPERVTLTFADNGLLLSGRVEPEGKLTGWHGVYEQIGGIIF